MSIKKFLRSFWSQKPAPEERERVEDEGLVDNGEIAIEREVDASSDRRAAEKANTKKTEKKKNAFPGCQTQFESINGSQREQQLVIGLDLGTAFTKVVIAETRVAYAVPFSDVTTQNNKYLLPGILSILENGECTLGHSDNAVRQITNLKMRLLQGDSGLSCKSEMAAFLALVLRHARAWLFQEHTKTYQGTKLDWNVNVGLPTHNYHDDRLLKIYREIVEAAWFISTLSKPVSLELAEKIVSARMSEQGIDFREIEGDHVKEKAIHPDSIGLFPEFAAQVTGYVQSPLRQEDLHALVDVGAGTVDVTVFNVHRQDNEDKYPVFAKSVEPLGVDFLMLHRLKESGYDGEWTPDVRDAPPLDSEFADIVGITVEELRNQVDSPFQKKLTVQIFSQLAHTKANRYPRSQRWLTGVPLFWCGGGVKTEFYSRLFNMIKVHRQFPVNRAFLPKPDRLKADGLIEDEYDRLSVAYGLSFDQFDIGEIRRTSEVDDIEEETQMSGICSACGGTGGPRGNDCSLCGGSGFVH